MPTIEVTCVRCGGATSFDYPGDTEAPSIAWDCPVPECWGTNVVSTGLAGPGGDAAPEGALSVVDSDAGVAGEANVS